MAARKATMANIAITDSSTLEASIELTSDHSDFGKTPDSVIHFIGHNLVATMGARIDQAQLDSLCLGFTYGPPITLGTSGTYKIGGELKSNFTIFRAPLHPDADDPAPTLFPGDPFGDDAIPLANACYTQLQFTTAINAGFSSSSTVPYTISPGASLQSSASMFLCYPKGSYPTVKQSLSDAFSRYSIPTTRAELAALPQDAIFAYQFTGCLKASGQLNLLTLVNPTAGTSLSAGFGLLNVSAGPELTLGGTITLTSDFEIRIRKVGPNTLRIGHYRKQGSKLAVTFDAGAEVDAAAGRFDLIAAFYKLLGSNAPISGRWFEDNGAKDLADKIQDTLTAAVQQKLSIALEAASDATASDSTAFLFDFDLAQLESQAESQAALDALLRGDLSPLIMGAALPPGVSTRANVIQRIRSTSHTFSVNFLGVLSYADVEKFALKSTARYTANGEVVLIDEATASDVEVAAAPVLTTEKLHHVLAQLFTATITYNCSLGANALDLVATQQFYQYERKIDHDTLTWFKDVVGQFGRSLQVPDGPLGGACWLSVALSYKKDAATRLFLDELGGPRHQDEFISIGRRAIVAAARSHPVLAYLLHLQESEPYWKAITGQDPGNLSWPMNDQQKQIFSMVVFAVDGWAASMARVSTLLTQMIAYTTANAGPQLPQDADFLRLKSQLATQLKQMAAKLEGQWVPAWSLFAVYLDQPPSTGQLNLGFLKQNFPASLP